MRGRYVFADIVAAYGQFSVTAVDQYAKLDFGGTSGGDQRVNGGARRAAGVDDVVHKHDGLALDGETEVSLDEPRLVGFFVKIVPVKRDV